MRARRNNSRVDVVYEAVGLFDKESDLQAAVDDLQSYGFMQQELSVLAGEKAVQEKLGQAYLRTSDAADDPAAPRSIFISKASLGSGEGSLIGLPLYIAAVLAAGITAAAGGSVMAAILAAFIAGGAAALLGLFMARFMSRRHADRIKKQIDSGGLLLWVHLRSPDMRKRAVNILKKHAARNVHTHIVPLYG